MEKIYAIEDDENIRNLLTIAIKGFGYEPIAFETAEDALLHIEEDQPDLAIFDLMLPGMDGLTAISKLRALPSFASLPVLILTAKDKELDKVAGLDNGADDYMVKPFGVLELGARIRSLLRRSRRGETPAAEDGVLCYGGIRMDTRRHEISIDGKPVALTNKEYGLLAHLMEHPSFVATRDALLSAVWGYDYDGESRTVDMHIKSLRQKLGDEEGKLIQTVRGIGYKLK